jgi:plastocyanin
MKLLTMMALLLGCSFVLAQQARERDTDEQPHGNVVTIARMQYAPATIRIKAGEAVTWKNEDERDHNVEAEDGSFRSGNIRAGSSWQHRFTRAGRYAYGCSYHPREKGVVIVE